MLRPNSTDYPRSDMIQPSEWDGPPAVTFTTITSQDAPSHWMNPTHRNGGGDYIDFDGKNTILGDL